MLILEDFKIIKLYNITYYSYKNINFEICLEHCLNGFEVAIYDLKQNLLEPKICTNLESFVFVYKYQKALEIANKFYNKYKVPPFKNVAEYCKGELNT